MIDLDAIEQFARLNTFDSDAEASDAEAKRPDADELLALVRVARAAQNLAENPLTWGYAYDVPTMAALRDALAPFRKETAA